jgi:hypothetical protein
MKEEDQDQAGNHIYLQSDRAELKKTIETITENGIPYGPPLLQPRKFSFITDWRSRFESARDKAIEAWKARPITDEDWQRELKRRAHRVECEHEPVVIHASGITEYR